MAVTTTDIPVKPGTGSLLSGHSPPPPPPPGAIEAIQRLGQADTKNVQEIAASQCEACNTEVFSYHSCGNRSCPKCHTAQTQEWLERRQAELLPVP